MTAPMTCPLLKPGALKGRMWSHSATSSCGSRNWAMLNYRANHWSTPKQLPKSPFAICLNPNHLLDTTGMHHSPHIYPTGTKCTNQDNCQPLFLVGMSPYKFSIAGRSPCEVPSSDFIPKIDIGCLRQGSFDNTHYYSYFHILYKCWIMNMQCHVPSTYLHM